MNETFDEWNRGKAYNVTPNGTEFVGYTDDVLNTEHKNPAFEAKIMETPTMIADFNKMCALCIIAGGRPVLDGKFMAGNFGTNAVAFVFDNGENAMPDYIDFTVRQVADEKSRRYLLEKIDSVFGINKEHAPLSIDDRIAEVSTAVYDIYKKYNDIEGVGMRKLAQVHDKNYLDSVNFMGESPADYFIACQTDVRNLSPDGAHSARLAMYLRMASARATQVYLLNNPDMANFVYPVEYRNEQNDIAKMVDSAAERIAAKIYVGKFSPTNNNEVSR